MARRAGFGVPFTRMLAAVRIIAILGVAAGLGALVTADARQGASVTPAPSASGLGRAQAVGGGSDVAAMFGTYCLTCHNTRTRTGNLTLEGFSLAGVHDDAGAEVGEKILRRLRTGMMPPPGMPRPNEATIAAVVLRLESTLDEAAHRRPQTGRAMLRRLKQSRLDNSREAVIAELASIDLLIIDDFALEPMTRDESREGFRKPSEARRVRGRASGRSIDSLGGSTHSFRKLDRLTRREREGFRKLGLAPRVLGLPCRLRPPIG